MLVTTILDQTLLLGTLAPSARSEHLALAPLHFFDVSVYLIDLLNRTNSHRLTASQLGKKRAKETDNGESVFEALWWTPEPKAVPPLVVPAIGRCDHD